MKVVKGLRRGYSERRGNVHPNLYIAPPNPASKTTYSPILESSKCNMCSTRTKKRDYFSF